LPFLSTSRAAIVSSQAPYGQHKDGENDPDVSNTMQIPIGTGPFKVTDWDDHLCRLEAFPMYFQGRAHLDRVDILQIPWSAPALVDEKQEIESPFFHLVHNPSSSAGRDWTQIRAGVMVCKLLTCNTQKTGPLSDPDVRAHVQTCITKLYGNGMNESNGDSGDADKVLMHAEELTYLSQHPTFELPIPLHITTIPQYRMDARRLASSLEMYGFTCTVRIGTMEQFKGNLRLESDLILFSLIRDRDEELRRYDLYLTLSEHLEDSSKKSVQEMLQTVVSSKISADRTAELDRIEQFLVQQSLLFHLTEKPVETAYLPSVRGLSFNSQGWVYLRHIWFP
jgi:MarR-like DNA-binding transcriptional regulator SgrR of sgrS sRNA